MSNITNETKAFVIIALNTESESHDLEILERIGFSSVKTLIGVYNNKPELSYLIPLNDIEWQLKKLKSIASEYNQHSILFVNDLRHAELLFIKSGLKENVGLFREVTKSLAIDKHSYTYDEMNKRYYIAG